MCSRTRYLVFCLIVFGSYGKRNEDNFRLNKCCPKEQKLDEELNCVDKTGDEYADDPAGNELSWFPITAIVDAATMNILEGRFNRYRTVVGEKYATYYGKIPECREEDTRQFALYKYEAVEWFNFIMDEEDGMKVHVSKPSSYHDPERSLFQFNRVAGGSEPLLHSSDSDSIRTLPLTDTCVDIGIENIHVLIYCPCRAMLCIRKCCPDDHHFSIESFSCQENGLEKLTDWRPKRNASASNYYLLSDTYPSCDVPILLKYHNDEYSSCSRYSSPSDNQFIIFPNGSLKVSKYKTLFNTSQYCGEVTVSANGTVEEQNLILCSASSKEEDAYEPVTHTLYGVLLLIGGICLLLTVLVSLLLPSLRRKVHNKIALSHNVSLMLANFTWAVPQLSSNLSPSTCVFLAFLEQFTILGSFFWLNVMCIDISMTFSSNRHISSSPFHGGTKKFVYYCVYAWGSASLISIITIVMEYHPEVTWDYLKPGFACVCGFNTGNGSIVIYLYGPMTLLLLANLVLFAYTTTKIMKIQKQTAMLRKSDSNTVRGSTFQSDRQRLILYGKLFLLMGITWITEIISWGIGGPSYYWYFSDVLNLLRAVFIFLLFVCKRQVIRNLRRRLNGESQSYSEKTGSARSHTDETSVGTTYHECRNRCCGRNAGGCSKRKIANKTELEFTNPTDLLASPSVQDSTM